MRWILGHGLRWACKRRAGSVCRGHIADESWLKARLRDCFEPGSQGDQRRLTEGGSDEADAHRQPWIVRAWRTQSKYLRRRYVDDWISWRPGKSRAGKQEVVAKHKVCRPGWAVGWREECVEVIRAQCRVNVDAQLLVQLQSVVVGGPACCRAVRSRGGKEGRLAKVRGGSVESLGRQEDFLAEVRHFQVCMSIVEVDCVLQRASADRHARTRSKVGGQVILDVVEQNEELSATCIVGERADGRRYVGAIRQLSVCVINAPSIVEIEDLRAGCADRINRIEKPGLDLRRGRVDAGARHSQACARKPLGVEELRVIDAMQV